MLTLNIEGFLFFICVFILYVTEFISIIYIVSYSKIIIFCVIIDRNKAENYFRISKLGFIFNDF